MDISFINNNGPQWGNLAALNVRKNKHARTVVGACWTACVGDKVDKPARKTQHFFLFARAHCVLAPWKLVVVLLKITVLIDRGYFSCGLILLYQWYAEGKELSCATFPAGAGQDTGLHQSWKSIEPGLTWLRAHDHLFITFSPLFRFTPEFVH